MVGSYPVIFLSLTNVKETNYTNARRKICQLLVELYSQYHFLQNSDKLTPQDRDFFNRISVDMGDVEATLALGQLSKYLFLYYGKKVLFLLDEYDTPMQEAYANGYWKELSAFIRGIFNAAFKTNAYMERAIMTGITRIGKESIFSDLNNPRIISATTDSYTDSFGFTREEVRLMFEEMIEEWFSESVPAYNDFIRAMLCDDVNRMNLYMNEVAFRTFSFFDSGNVPSRSEPERFYHGFVLGLMVDLSEQYVITSNQESGFGRYDVMLEPKNKQDNAFILEFKVFDPDAKEKTLEDTVYSAQKQIETKGYAASLIAKGIAPEQIRKYGFAFEGKRVLIG